MKILKISLEKRWRHAVKEAASVVKQGELIVYPTDTVYGLGGDPFNEEAVKKVFKVKQRGDKPLPILCSSISDVEQIAYVPEWLRPKLDLVWPGPVTLILKKKPSLPEIVTCGREDVGVRIPGMGFTLELIKACGGFLMGTSANISGTPPPSTVDEALAQLKEEISLVIDAGPTPLKISSTVIDLTVQPPRVLREGYLAGAELRKLLEELTQHE
ncbi:MAG: threonylcarbamoyl-AMP synthase [Candidatus Verstraetearchaeota archaeon]|nr:threonylcarbamoyl-AMP synthase [Candidatus Verstraetearchaeota archaeon]